jgi:hypothetical protein
LKTALAALTLMVNILLDQPEVVKNLLATDKDDVLDGYVTEMLRIDPPLQGIYREARADETVGTTAVKGGDLIYLNITTANKNVSFRVLVYPSGKSYWCFRSVRLRNRRRSIIPAPRSITSAVTF